MSWSPAQRTNQCAFTRKFRRALHLVGKRNGMRTCAVTLAANTLAVCDRIATACLPRHCKSDTQTNHFWLHMCIKNGAPAVNFTFTTLPWPMLAVSKVLFYSNDKLCKLRSLLHNACAERCLLGVRKKITKIERKRSYMIHGYSYLHFKHKQTNGTS